jgi:glycosyltransferase involved in cell wall biosynthesis
VGLDNYPVLNPECGGEHFGGESVQQTLLARAFVDLGYEVSMVVKDHGQMQGEYQQGIRVWKTFTESEGLPAIRFIYPRFTRIWQALKMADADIYYQSCAGSLTGYVAWFCRKYGRKFIFRLAHDSDCIPGEQLIKHRRDRLIYEYGLRNADLISAQGVNQVELLQQHYKLESVPVNMAVELPDDDAVNQARKDVDVLWVNNLRAFKRPELLLELARKLPEYRFVMIGGEVRGYEQLYRDISRQADEVENVEYLGAVPYHEVNSYFFRAKLFLNTSDQEGFPNSFLQAWVRRIPVVSFFDPDGLIASQNLGDVPTDLGGMEVSVRNLLQNAGLRSSAADRSREYVLANYAPAAVARVYEDLLSGDGKSKLQ